MNLFPNTCGTEQENDTSGITIDMDESLSDGIPKKYKHIKRTNSFTEWEIPPWDLKLMEVIGQGQFGRVHRARCRVVEGAA